MKSVTLDDVIGETRASIAAAFSGKSYRASLAQQKGESVRDAILAGIELGKKEAGR